jgi:Transposase Tn5 dimerisation domain
VLLTSLPVESFKDGWQIIDDYEHRWLIEDYHKVLKTGCSSERHALRTAHRLEALIGLISVIGVRLFQMKTFAKQEPDAQAAQRVPSAWIKALKALRPRLQTAGLTVSNFFREMPKLGGCLGRKSDGEPGWQTIWRGFKKLQLIVQATELIKS